ncbi:hypothetical protein F2Q70_00034536 [Brassica cretica]|uniref:Uncharacterized protein n=1 Tax=Brassica cretica TaxID=69181 RepID=A0A8S9JQ30_BRACR|nr:hypothetical protein F2Q70_00034536 [Brassica cretica]
MIADDDKVTLTAHSRKRFEIPPKCKKDCKAYLRKQFFIERILEHWRIRDGRGESLYPRSSSAIKLYEKMKASEDIMGRRTVAGKVQACRPCRETLTAIGPPKFNSKGLCELAFSSEKSTTLSLILRSFLQFTDTVHRADDNDIK